MFKTCSSSGIYMGSGFRKKSWLTFHCIWFLLWIIFCFYLAVYFNEPGAALYPLDFIFLWKVTGMFVFCNFVGNCPNLVAVRALG